jgi:hypothetical protein
MIEQPSYTVPAGNRWGCGSATVLRYLLKDLAQKARPAPAEGTGNGGPRVAAHPFP